MHSHYSSGFLQNVVRGLVERLGNHFADPLPEGVEDFDLVTCSDRAKVGSSE